MPQVIPYAVGYALSGTAYAGYAALAVVVTAAVVAPIGKDQAVQRARP